VPRYFSRAWTISSPAPPEWGEGVGRSRGIIGRVPQPLVSARSCLRFTLQQASLRIPIPKLSGAGFPEFTRCFNHSFLWKLQRCVSFSVVIHASAYIDFLATAHAVYSRLLCRIELPRIMGKVVAKGRRSVKRTRCLCTIPTFLAALRSHDQESQHPHIQHLHPWGFHERYDSRERQAA
jgi:hypothetical protein